MKKVVLLFDLRDHHAPNDTDSDYVWVGDAQGGVWIRGVTRSYPEHAERSPLLAAMDDAELIIRPGESLTNCVPAWVTPT